MPRSQKNDNFIDKTFGVIADILLQVIPTSRQEKEAFAYYRDGLSAQAEGEYAEEERLPAVFTMITFTPSGCLTRAVGSDTTSCSWTCQVQQMHMFWVPPCKRPCCFVEGHKCMHCCAECLRRLEGRDTDATELAEGLQPHSYTWPCLTCGRPDTSYYVDRKPIYCYRCGT